MTAPPSCHLFAWAHCLRAKHPKQIQLCCVGLTFCGLTSHVQTEMQLQGKGKISIQNIHICDRQTILHMILSSVVPVQCTMISGLIRQKYITPPTISFVWILFGLLHRDPKQFGSIQTKAVPNPDQPPLRIFWTYYFFCTKHKIIENEK